MNKNTENNFSDNSWQIPKKVKEKSKKWKIFGYVFLWGFFVFSGLVSADYYFFYKENNKYFSDQKAGFELIGENIKNNFEQKKFSDLEKNILVLEEKISKNYSEISEKISEKNFLVGSEKILDEVKNFSDDGIILVKNFLEMEKLGTGTLEGTGTENPVENILKLNSQNLKILEKFKDEFDFNIFDKLALNLVKNEDLLVLNKIKNAVFLTTNISEELEKNKEFISEIFGKNSPQTSVLFFQNSNESRVTGGFVGSFLIFTTNSGKILSWKIHDIYEFDGQLKGNFEKIPFEAKSLVGDENWSLRDFNSNPDLEISSKNFNYFFEKSGGKTVDNFFYLDSKILSEILKITGEIELKNLGISVDSNNWDFVFQYFVESKKNYFVSPKKLLIGEIFSSLKEKILSGKIENFREFFNFKNEVLQKNYLKFYSNNSEILNLFEKNIFEKKDEIEKYFISISSNKSDKFIENNFKTRKENSSEKIISLKRNFFIDENFSEFFEFLFENFGSDIPKDELKKILGFGENNSILQFYTEKNFDLLFVKHGTENLDFKTWKQGEKNVFEINLPKIKNGEKQEIFFNWKKN